MQVYHREHGSNVRKIEIFRAFLAPLKHPSSNPSSSEISHVTLMTKLKGPKTEVDQSSNNLWVI